MYGRRGGLRSGPRSSERDQKLSFGRRILSLGNLGLQFFDMGLKLFESGPTKQVETDHLIGSLGWLCASVDQDQYAGDDCQVHLNLNATWFSA